MHKVLWGVCCWLAQASVRRCARLAAIAFDVCSSHSRSCHERCCCVGCACHLDSHVSRTTGTSAHLVFVPASAPCSCRFFAISLLHTRGNVILYLHTTLLFIRSDSLSTLALTCLSPHRNLSLLALVRRVSFAFSPFALIPLHPSSSCTRTRIDRAAILRWCCGEGGAFTCCSHK
jgi:hypothetical protein